MYSLRQKSSKTARRLKAKAILHYQRGETCLNRAQLGQAQDHLEKALKAYWLASDSPGTALCLLKLGRVLELTGHYSQAAETYHESFIQYLHLNDNPGIARSKAFLGNAAWAQGDYSKALKLLEESLLYFKGSGDIQGQAWVHDLMGNLHLAMGKEQVAETYHRTAFAMAREIGENVEARAWNDYHLAAIELHRRRIFSALEGFLSALKHFTRMGDVLGEVATLIHLGEIACDQKDYAGAESFLLKAVRLVLPTQCKPLLADALTCLARLLKGQGEGRKAIGVLMVVLSHPTCRQQTKDRMVSLAESLETYFSPREIESGFRWAKEFTLEEMASAWLAAISSKPRKKGSAQKLYRAS